ncbi:MAG TPA: outer membrane beta-barrel protein [Gemmatimonadaceae bacterium]|nr:outer membrane beta-barrel protein [Gemmatimonadaceae bacterium]
MALVSLPFEGRAQVSTIVKPVQFGIAAGAAIPTSDLSDFASTGFNGTVTVGLNPAMIPLGIRIDGAYNQFSVKDAFGGGDAKFISVTGNLVYKIPGATVSPYAIGGVGLYNADIEVAGFPADAENKFGWNLGGGISMALSGFDTFIEARYNQVQTDTPLKYIPITFGIMF